MRCRVVPKRSLEPILLAGAYKAILLALLQPHGNFQLFEVQLSAIIWLLSGMQCVVP